MGAAAAEAPLRLPAAPPLAFCCYTSVLLLFAFSLPGSRASNQPPGGGGGDCPGGRGKSINCSGRTGQQPPRDPSLRGSPTFSPFPWLGWETPRGVPGAGRAGAERAWAPALGTGSGRACVCPWVSSGWARAAPRAGCRVRGARRSSPPGLQA